MTILKNVYDMYKRKVLDNSIRNRIFIFTFSVLCSSFIVFTILISIVINSKSIETAKNNVKSEVGIINNSLDLFVNSIEDSVINISIDNEVQRILSAYHKSKDSNRLYKAQKELTDVINQSIGISESIISCDIMTPDNNIIQISPILDSEVDNLLNKVFKNKKDYEPLCWYGPYKLKHYSGLENQIFVIEKRILSIDTPEVLGTLYMYVNQKSISNVYKQSFENNNIKFYIIDRNNMVISATNESAISKPLCDILNISYEKLHDLFSHGKDVIKINNTNSYISIKEIKKTEWKIISIVTMKIIKEVSTIINRYLLLFTLINILFSMFISKVLANYLAKPIVDLAQVMKEIKKGKRNIRANKNVPGELKLLNNTFNSLMNKNDELINEIYEGQKEVRKYEFRIIQEQMKPHFLYNTLTIVSSLIKLDLKQDALNAVNNLAKFFRISLSEGKDIITLKEELSLVDSYLTIQRYRYKDLFNYNIEVDDKILDNTIPKLILQPLVENSIYHGIKAGFKDKVQINIDCKVIKDKVIISITDYGLGIKEDKLDDIKKNLNTDSSDEYFGLKSIHKRIQLMYGEEYGLTLDSKYNTYTNISVTLPSN